MIEAKLQVLACHGNLHLVSDKVITLLHFKPQHTVCIEAGQGENAWIGDVIVLPRVKSFQLPGDHHVLIDAHSCKDLVFRRLIIRNDTICVLNFDQIKLYAALGDLGHC